MKLLVSSTIFFLLFFFGRLTMSLFVQTVPIFETYLTPLFWLSVIAGTIAGLCILIKLIKEIKGIFTNGKNNDKAE